MSLQRDMERISSVDSSSVNKADHKANLKIDLFQTIL